MSAHRGFDPATQAPRAKALPSELDPTIFVSFLPKYTNKGCGGWCCLTLLLYVYVCCFGVVTIITSSVIIILNFVCLILFSLLSTEKAE